MWMGGEDWQSGRRKDMLGLGELRHGTPRTSRPSMRLPSQVAVRTISALALSRARAHVT